MRHVRTLPKPLGRSPLPLPLPFARRTALPRLGSRAANHVLWRHVDIDRSK